MTIKRISTLFFWSKIHQATRYYIQNCIVCQQCKVDLATSLGLLQPFPIPNSMWEKILMDFIKGLPTFEGKNMIFLTIDRVRKYA